MTHIYSNALASDCFSLQVLKSLKYAFGLHSLRTSRARAFISHPRRRSNWMLCCALARTERFPCFPFSYPLPAAGCTKRHCLSGPAQTLVAISPFRRVPHFDYSTISNKKPCQMHASRGPRELSAEEELLGHFPTAIPSTRWLGTRWRCALD